MAPSPAGTIFARLPSGRRPRTACGFRFLCAAFATCAAGASPVASQVAPDSAAAAVHFATAQERYRDGRLAEALAAYRAAGLADSSLPRLAAQFGTRAWRMGALADSWVWLRRALRDQPGQHELVWDLGVVHTFFGLDAAADSLYRRVLELNPQYAYAWGELGYLALAQGRFAGAIEPLERGLALDTTDLFSIGGLAEAHLYAGNPTAAISFLERALARDRTARGYGGKSVLTLLGFALWTSGRTDEARQLFTEALARLHARVAAGHEAHALRREIGTIHAVLGDRAEAWRWLEEAVGRGFRGYRWARHDPTLASLRDDPAFARWIATMAQLVEADRCAVMGPRP